MKKGNALLVLLLSAICLVPSVFGQGGIKGKVRNNKGGAIAGATITARMGGRDVKTVKSDSKGSFTMQGLDEGTYNLAFDADGYATGVKFAVQIKDGSVRDLGDRHQLLDRRRPARRAARRGHRAAGCPGDRRRSRSAGRGRAGRWRAVWL